MEKLNNISQLFYKLYFRKICFKDDKDSEQNRNAVDCINKKIVDSEFDFAEIKYLSERSKSLFNEFIRLKVMYPGLVTGIGINHEAGITGEMKLGMNFDYTSGMPVIYSSSVKGVLRSAFPERDKKILENDSDVQKKIAFNKKNDAKRHFIEIYLKKEIMSNGIGKVEDINTYIDCLRDNIFEGKGSDGLNLSVYKRDIFFDAVIIEANKKHRIIETDAITPHLLGPLKDPIPIVFFKIASGVKLEFRFKLNDCCINGVTFSKESKRKLFEEILKDIGAGAKTNVGYGQMR